MTVACSHHRAVPVESGGAVVAALCPDCDQQLPAEWLTCSHIATVDVTGLGQRHAQRRCLGCGAQYSERG